MITPLEKKIAGWFPFGWLLQKSKRMVLPGFEGVPLYDVMYFFRGQIERIGFASRTAAISFNILLALPAGLIFLCTLVPYLPSAVHFERNLLRALAQILNNNSTYSSLSGIIHDFFTTERSGLLSFSFIAAIFFSSNAMMGIMRTFDRSYFEERSSRFMAKRWTALKLTSLLMLLVFGTVLLLATQGSVRKFLLRELEWDTPVVRSIIQTIRWILITLLNYLSIAFIYRLAPAVKNKWPLISPGAILATLLTFITSYLFGLWVEHFGQFNKVYGSIGTMLIVMNLVYINALVLIIGFELNVSITAVKSRIMMEKTKENKSKDSSSPFRVS